MADLHGQGCVQRPAYFAFRKQGLADNDRWRIFLDRLDGKELRCEMEQAKPEEPQVLCGSRRLKPFEISFEGRSVSTVTS